jgi:nicotinate-nucleotide adenylyltransferase
VANNVGPLLLYGGSFDPVHNGHIAAFWQAAMQVGAVEARFIPCFISPLKSQSYCSVQQRCDLLSLVVDGLNARASGVHFKLDPRELIHSGPSYTCDTLASIRQEEGPRRTIIYLLGRDAWLQLPMWRAWQTLTDFAHLLIAQRPGDSAPVNVQQQAWANERMSTLNELAGSPQGAISQLDNALLAISATQIRQHITQGLRPVGCVPDAVELQIYQGLYKN